MQLISIATDIADFRQIEAARVAEVVAKKNRRFVLGLDSEPDVLDIFCYSYCYVGLFTGMCNFDLIDIKILL